MRPTYYIHPEFGYFCPAPGARRELRVAAASILFAIVIGAAIVTVGAGHAVETEGASSNTQLKPSSSNMLLPRGGVPNSLFKHGNNVQANHPEAIKPYPMRMVRLRPNKAASPLPAILAGRAIHLGQPGASETTAPSTMVTPLSVSSSRRTESERPGAGS